MKSALLDPFTSKKLRTARTAIIVQVAGRSGFDAGTAVLDRICAALRVHVAAQGIAGAGNPARP